MNVREIDANHRTVVSDSTEKGFYTFVCRNTGNCLTLKAYGGYTHCMQCGEKLEIKQ